VILDSQQSFQPSLRTRIFSGLGAARIEKPQTGERRNRAESRPRLDNQNARLRRRSDRVAEQSREWLTEFYQLPPGDQIRLMASLDDDYKQSMVVLKENINRLEAEVKKLRRKGVKVDITDDQIAELRSTLKRRAEAKRRAIDRIDREP